MTNDEREKSLAPADSANDAINTDRQILYQRNFGQLLDICLQSRELLIPDAENIVVNLASHLSDFTGDTDADFIEWASTILQPAVARVVFFYKILSEYQAVIHAAIWDTLGHNAEPNRYDDNTALEPELFQDICIVIMQKLDALMRRGKAKFSTRLYALARWQVRRYLKKQCTRYNAVNRRLSQGRGFIGVETLSDAEIAEMKAIEHQTAA